jgi:hypothetical protein
MRATIGNVIAREWKYQGKKTKANRKDLIT